MASRRMRRELDAAERDLLAGFESAIDRDGRILGAGRTAETEVALPARLVDFPVALVDHDLRAAQAFELRQTRGVVDVRVRRRKDLDVGDLEPELRHARGNLGGRVADAGVDKNVTGRRGDQVRGQIVTADPVDVAD